MRLSGEERRNNILEILAAASAPISGSKLSRELGVSRQVIVTDIALIKATHPDFSLQAQLSHQHPAESMFPNGTRGPTDWDWC